MNEGKRTLPHSRSPGTGSGRACPGLLLPALALAFGCILLQACALAPAVLVASAAVTTAGVAVEAEKATLDIYDPNSIRVTGSTEVHKGPGEQYPAVASLQEGDKVRVLGEDQDWIACYGKAFAVGWIHRSYVASRGN